jgi:hypothetical protein
VDKIGGYDTSQTGKILTDMDKFPTTIKKGKIALLPPSAAGKNKVPDIFQRLYRSKNRQMKYAYYPGCSAHSTARDMHKSSLAVAAALVQT